MKKQVLVFLFLMGCFLSGLQAQETARIQQIAHELELLAIDNNALSEKLKLDINVSKVTLPNLLIAISRVHRLNLTVAPDIGNIEVVNNFTDVTVADLLIFLCKEYELDIEFTGTILSIKRYLPPIETPPEKVLAVQYDPQDKSLSLDLQNDPIEKVFRKIMDLSGENLLYANRLAQRPLNIYLNRVPLKQALEQLAVMNDLAYSKSRDGFHLFSARDDSSEANNGKSGRNHLGNLNYQVLDTVNRILDVDFKQTPIANIIYELSTDLNLDVYTATPLEEAGTVTFKAKNITYDDMLEHIFESQDTALSFNLNPSPDSSVPSVRSSRNINPTPQAMPVPFTFKKENSIYFFGTADQLSVREVEIVQMKHRSVELLSDPDAFSQGGRYAGRTEAGNINYYSNGGQGALQNQGRNNQRRTVNTQGSNFNSYQNGAEALINILPEEIKSDLDIKVDFELNSFLVSGPSANINRFEKFIEEIDRPVPVILIEVMLIEVRKSATVETGISWGIGEEPVATQGKLFPQTDVTVGATTINKIIGGFDGFGSFNIGQVVPGFFATIKAMEENGNLKIRSTPKLSTLNGHRANLSIGETTYYVITNQNFFGSQIPTTSEVRNYAPIDAELAISIKPLVSGDGQVTLEIYVIQSDFSGDRIEPDAPPNVRSREFSSIIRMQNQDLAILGGLEEKVKNDSGKGVPLLARIPVIKWLFSERKREDTKQKLTILIKPTVIY
jgi:type IV pilus assembly protein PilQ